MKRLPTKAQIRTDLEKQIQSYLEDGGVVHNIPKGESGCLDNRNIFSQFGGNPPRQERTPLSHVAKNLDARKNSAPPPKRHKRPKKKLITDDFGEPLRWVWVED